MKHRIHELLVNGLHAAFNWKPRTTLWENQCRRTSQNLIALLDELGMEPREFWDVGANESQIARWLVNNYPGMAVISFEPCQRFTPLGTVLRLALSDEDEGKVTMTDQNFSGEACPHIGYPIGEACEVVEAVRFDSLNFSVRSPAVLKIDAENYTLKALRGFGARLDDFAVVVCEIVNHMPDQSQMRELEAFEAVRIHHLMEGRGFTKSRVLDTGSFYQNRITHLDVAFWR